MAIIQKKRAVAVIYKNVRNVKINNVIHKGNTLNQNNTFVMDLGAVLKY